MTKQSTLAGVIFEYLSDNMVTGGKTRTWRTETAFELTNYICHRIEGAEKWVEEKNKEDAL